MFEDMRRLFRESVDAFRRELHTREPEDQVAELLAAMRRELVAARAAIPETESELARARSELERERSALAECERRGALAERIGDAETVRVAAEFAGRHRARAEVLAQKAAAAEAELRMRRGEAEEMKRRYREAELNRFALLAALRRGGARGAMEERLGEERGPQADWSRMAERVEGDAAYADALEEVEGHTAEPEAPRPREAQLEERLRELKRRMGRE